MRLTNSDRFLDHYGLGWMVDYVLFCHIIQHNLLVMIIC